MSSRAGDASPSTGGFYGFSPDPSTVTYHPVGNSPPVDLTEGRRLPPQPPQLLLLGCGDIRSVLHTAHVLCTSCPPAQLPTALHFHLNDIEAGVLARDLVLLRLASAQDASLPASEDAQFLWSVWYEALLGSRHAARLQDVLKDLCQEVSRGQGDDVAGPNGDVSQGQRGDVAGSGDDVSGRQDGDVAGSGDVSQGQSDDVERNVQGDGKPIDFHFGNEETRDAVKEALEEYSRMSVCTIDVFKGRNERIAEMNRSPNPVGQATERIASVFQEQQGCMKDPLLRVRCRKEIEGFVRTGMTSVPWSSRDEAELRQGYTGNPTYFRPGSTTWCVTESACVFLSRDLDLSASGYDRKETTLSSLFFRQMAEHVTSFQKLQRQRGVKMTFTLWHGEALTLSESILPASLRFDFINTSNLADNVGLLNLLVMYGSSRLRPGSGLLSLQSFYWHNVDSLQEYLQKSMIVDPNVIQSVLGLKWGGDERSLNCRTFRLGTFVGREAYRFFFVSTPEPSEKITLTGEDEVTGALQKLLDFCCRPRSPALLIRPIVSGLRTYLRLGENLSRRIEGGLDVIQGLSLGTLVQTDDPVLTAMAPSFAGLTFQFQSVVGQRAEHIAVEVSLPVEVEGKEELHFCYIVLTPLKSLDGTLMLIEMSNFSPFLPTPCLVIVKDFTFDDRRKRVSFVLPADVWEKVPSDVNACFENCAPGRECLLKTVPRVKEAASVRRLPRKQEEKEGPDEAAGHGKRATRRGLTSLQLVEHRDSFTVSIKAAEGTALERLSVSGGESARHVQVTAGKGRGGLLWKAVLPCEVRADLSKVEVDKDNSTVKLDIPKDEGELGRVPWDVRPVDARRLPSYQYDRHSELTLYLNFWRAFPSEGVHLGQDLWPHPLAPHVAARDLVLETSHAAIHRGTPLVVSVERQDGDEVRRFLLLQLHGFKILDDAPALIVTVLWPEEAITLMEEGKLRRRAFEAELHEMLRLPRHSVATTPLVQAAIPVLVEQLTTSRRQLVQDPHRDASWLFQSCLRPLHSQLNWIAHYAGVNQTAGCPGAFSNLLRGASFASGGKVGDYAWCCPREDYASMCLKCLLASGREFHHLQKNTEDGAKGMFSIGSLMTTFVSAEGVEGEDARTCCYCRSRPDRLSECRGCGRARYCCEQCQTRDWERHREACASPSLPPHVPASAADLSQAPRADQAASGQPPTAEEARHDVPEDRRPESRHSVGGARPKSSEASSVSWWKSGARVQSSAAAVRKPCEETRRAGVETAARSSEGRERKSQARDSRPTGKKTAAAVDSSVSWWTAGVKVQSSTVAGHRPSGGTKPDARLSTRESEGQDPDSKTVGKAAGKDAEKNAGKDAGKDAREDSSVSWWKPGARVQRSGCQGSRPAGETRRPAGVDSAPEIPDVILQQAGIARCDVCRKPTSAMKRCGRCKKRSYCSGDCQAQDWKEHRKSCTPLP